MHPQSTLLGQEMPRTIAQYARLSRQSISGLPPRVYDIAMRYGAYETPLVPPMPVLKLPDLEDLKGKLQKSGPERADQWI